MKENTMKYHYAATRMTVMKETGNTKCQWQYEKLECSYMVGENVNCYTHFGKNLP